MNPCDGKFCPAIKFADFYTFMEALLGILITILFPVLILMIVYTGFLFLMAQGNASKLQEAKRALLWTIVGGMVILGSLALAAAIRTFVTSVTP